MKTVYYTNKNTGEVRSYFIDDIDANEAVRKHPSEYSFEHPGDPAVEVVHVKTPQEAMANGDNLPPSAIGGDDATTETAPASTNQAAAPAAAAPAA